MKSYIKIDVDLPFDKRLSEELDLRLIDILPFGGRLRNCLEGAGINTIRSMCKLSLNDYQKLRKFGAKCVAEIRAFFEIAGLSFGMSDEELDEYMSGIDKPVVVKTITSDELQALVEAMVSKTVGEELQNLRIAFNGEPKYSLYAEE